MKTLVGLPYYGMSVERLEVAASGLSFVMGAFPLLSVGKKEEKEGNPKKSKEEEINTTTKTEKKSKQRRKGAT